MVNNWIYIDGGYMIYQANDSNRGGDSNRVNTTFAIDLSRNWTNSTLKLVQSPAPSDAVWLSYESLWFDRGRNSIYRFGSLELSPDSPLDGAPITLIWGFNLSDEGTAAWYPVLGEPTNLTFSPPANTTPFPSDLYPVYETSTSDGNRAYYLGDLFPSGTNSQRRGCELVTFDFNTRKVTNTTDDYGLALKDAGQLISIPTYGDDGILVIIPDTFSGPHNNLTLYDKKNHRWYSQIASGDMPSPRSSFCAVGAGGDKNNTFEIYVHGGVIEDNASYSKSGLYILSLPSFHWFRASNGFAFKRTVHTCHISNNQMILIGGRTGSPGDGHDRDPEMQTFGVFDLASWRYKSSYEAGANAYKTPEFITKYYSTAGSPYPSSWTSAGVKALFEGKPQNTSNSTGLVPSSPSGAAAPSSRPRRPGHGEVAGIAVGCTAFVVTCAVCGTFTMRHILKKSKLKELACPSPQLLPSESQRVELSASPRPQELLTEKQDRAELPHTNALHELFSGTTTCAELPG
ncbi:hypothetical protein MMC07_003583 [Pseudocyphellaria aurata]|nr:hypothetical protein [Pseudocyphellaria aurata]